MTWDHGSFCRKLEDATRVRDLEEIDLRVAELCHHLYHAQETYPESEAIEILECLKRGSFKDDMVLLTNAHVVSETVRNAIRPDEAVILFESHDGLEPVEYAVTELLWSSPPDELDTTILRLDKPVEGIEPCPVHSRLPSPNRSRVYIIGHPQGGTLSFSMQDNKLLDHEAPVVHYHAPTEPGSSGSPVFNSQWKLIAIHHAGGMKLRKLNGKAGTYRANEGLWIQSIIGALKEGFDGSP